LREDELNTRRKLVIALGAGALAWTGAVRAQASPTVRRIGLFSQTSPSVTAPSYEAFRLGLRDLGWVEGKNISIEYRYAEGRHDRLPDLAAELVRLKLTSSLLSLLPILWLPEKATALFLSLRRVGLTLLREG
jgi:putative ABC transport system substrate-binding protein